VVLVEKDLRGDSIMKEHLNAAILAVAILLAVTIYCLFAWNHNRYRLEKTGYKNAVNLIDTKTGEAWCLVAEEDGLYGKYKYKELLTYTVEELKEIARGGKKDESTKKSPGRYIFEEDLPKQPEQKKEEGKPPSRP
jgi:hypothetical protein